MIASRRRLQGPAFLFGALVLSACGVGTHASYETCGVSADCATTTDRCLSVTAGMASASICSTPCVEASECPVGRPGGTTECRVFTGSTGGNCFQSCTVDADCSEGLGCFDPEGGTHPLCMPVTTP